MDIKIENYQKTIASLIGSKQIAFNRDIAEFLGNDITCAIFINQLLYWWQKGKHQDKIFKSDKEFYNECGLTKRMCKRAREKLKEIDWISYKKEGIPPINHYYINIEKIAEDLTEWVQQKSQNVTINGDKMLPALVTKSTQYSKEYTKNTTKNNNSFSVKTEKELQSNSSNQQQKKFCEHYEKIKNRRGEFPFFCKEFRRLMYCNRDSKFCTKYFNRVKRELKELGYTKKHPNYHAIFMNRLKNILYSEQGIIADIRAENKKAPPKPAADLIKNLVSRKSMKVEASVI